MAFKNWERFLSDTLGGRYQVPDHLKGQQDGAKGQANRGMSNNKKDVEIGQKGAKTC